MGYWFELMETKRMAVLLDDRDDYTPPPSLLLDEDSFSDWLPESEDEEEMGEKAFDRMVSEGRFA